MSPERGRAQANTAEHYDPNLPAIEGLQAARHFKLGPKAYASQSYSPWIAGHHRPLEPGAKRTNS